jgi:acyl-CoA thioesterase-2
MPAAPPPEALVSDATYWADRLDELPKRARLHYSLPQPIEFRPVERRPAWQEGSISSPSSMAWFRSVAPLENDPAMHRAVLAYASDIMLLTTSLLPHGKSFLSDALQGASLDHALWLHDDVQVDDWILYVTDSPWAGQGRGFNRGRMFARDGRLIASVAQEGLIRVRS